ncbi:MAG: sensor histidine kinase [Sphingobacterium sp.]
MRSFHLPLIAHGIHESTEMEEELLNVKNRRLILFWTATRYRAVRHLIFLVAFFVFLWQSSLRHEFVGHSRFLAVLIINSVFVWMFYTNMYILVPYLFMRGRHLLYVISLALLVGLEMSVLAIIFEHLFDTEGLRKTHEWRDVVDAAFIAMLIIFASTGMKLFQRWAVDVARIAELQQLSHDLELSVLKNQINPHFLFNMLNNVKSLTRKDPEMAGMVIVKLSDFLRYQIYGKDDEKILFTSEIEFLSNFLDLEKIRRENFRVGIEIQEQEATSKELLIPANLFTTFVENAIKYSVDPDGRGSFIELIFELDDHTLRFTCRNSLCLQELPEQVAGGLGLANIRRRLDLLFENRYHLETRSETDVFIVYLEIEL